MSGETSLVLLGTFMAPAIGTLTAMLTLTGRHQWLGRACTRLGFAAGALGAAIVAFQLANLSESTGPAIHSPTWVWCAFSQPRWPAVVFGLEATLLKAVLACLMCSAALVGVWIGRVRAKAPLPAEALVIISALVTAGLMFVLSPFLAQSLLGWAAISFCAGILIRAFSSSAKSTSPADFGSAPLQTPPPSGDVERAFEEFRAWLREIILQNDRVWIDRVWRPVTQRFPTWLGEQFTPIEEGSLSTQLLVTMLGVFAILLTWLIGRS